MTSALINFEDIKFTDKEFLQDITNKLNAGIIVLLNNGKVLSYNKVASDIFSETLVTDKSIKYLKLSLKDCEKTSLSINFQEKPNNYFLKEIDFEKDYNAIVGFENSKNKKHIDCSFLKKTINGNKAIVLLFTDSSKTTIANELIQDLSFRDSLTNLPNRKLLLDRLKQGIAEAKRFDKNLAVMFLDLDLFKKVNDSLGHAAGDLLLKFVAKRLTACLRETDTLSRLGGDEFVILLPGFKCLENLSKIAHKILKALEMPFNIKGHEVYITGSIGISVFPFDGSDTSTLMRNADTAMYVAKEHRGNTYQFFSSEMNEKLIRRLEIENGLRKALEHDELYLEYQPQVDMITGKITGAEALLRWYHPEKGNISPAEFIPIAEETGLITPIGEWVIRKACQEFLPLANEEIYQLDLSINLSGRQFEKPNLNEVIREILFETKFPGDRLKLEITESILMENAQNAKELLLKLKLLGIKISIDDFGTGYSSLGYLKNFSIDQIKIDKSFTDEIKDANAPCPIIETIISLAKSLNVELIAEGVESETQRIFLILKGCRYAQGYYFGKPKKILNFISSISIKKNQLK
ncbi:MAG: putative bifunctional diguanylate cyclase/phosphodiesterase [Pedobacter sp.]